VRTMLASTTIKEVANVQHGDTMLGSVTVTASEIIKAELLQVTLIEEDRIYGPGIKFTRIGIFKGLFRHFRRHSHIGIYFNCKETRRLAGTVDSKDIWYEDGSFLAKSLLYLDAHEHQMIQNGFSCRIDYNPPPGHLLYVIDQKTGKPHSWDNPAVLDDIPESMNFFYNLSLSFNSVRVSYEYKDH